MNKIKLSIFASGNGSNAMKIIDFFKDSNEIDVVLLVTNNKMAGILGKSKGKVEQAIISNEEAKDGNFLLGIMQSHQIDYIVLAGYLRRIPEVIIAAFPRQIINIHPALLPKYGGKGMYGMNVHRAVQQNKETESGISIHLVNEQYDKGQLIAQYKTAISINECAEEIQKKVMQLEHQYFAPTLADYIISQQNTKE